MKNAVEIPQHTALGLSKLQNDHDALCEIRNMFPEEWTCVPELQEIPILLRAKEAGIKFETVEEMAFVLTVMGDMNVYQMDTTEGESKIRRASGEFHKLSIVDMEKGVMPA